MIRKLTNIKDVAFGELIRLRDDEQETISLTRCLCLELQEHLRQTI